MKRLEDISKQPVFKVPDGYFDELPSRIQARISSAEKSNQPTLLNRYKLAFAIPIFTVLAVVFVLILRPDPKDAETILASVETEQLVAYLQDTEVTTEDLLQNIEFNDEEIDQIESQVYQLDLTDEELNSLFDLDDI